MKIPQNDPWTILEIEPGSSQQKIKQAYKQKAMLHHPDRGGNIIEFQLIQDAYDRLKKHSYIPVKRTRDSKLVNVSLSFEEQINGLDGLITISDNLSIKVTIPPGANINDKFSIIDRGKKYIINIKDIIDNVFTKQGYDVILVLSVDLVTILKGGTVTIQSPESFPIDIEIPAGLNNSILTIKDNGLYDRKKNTRGNLIIQINSIFPDLSSVEQQEKFITRLRNE